MSSRSRRLCVPVRLCDLPHDVVARAAAAECRHASDESERVELLALAIWPPDTVHWVARSAAPLLADMGVRLPAAA